MSNNPLAHVEWEGGNSHFPHESFLFLPESLLELCLDSPQMSNFASVDVCIYTYDITAQFRWKYVIKSDVKKQIMKGMALFQNFPLELAKARCGQAYLNYHRIANDEHLQATILRCATTSIRNIVISMSRRHVTAGKGKNHLPRILLTVIYSDIYYQQRFPRFIFAVTMGEKW